MFTKNVMERYFDSILRGRTNVCSWERSFFLSVFAGAFIALAGAASCVASSIAGKIAGACVFPIGLIMVGLSGSELFTGNCLITIALLDGKMKPKHLLKLWLVVYIGNLFGSVLIAAATVFSGMFDTCYAGLITTAVTKINLDFGTALLKGILCNILVCLAVWFASTTDNTGVKIFCWFAPVFVFVLCGFEHSVANMFYLPAGLFASNVYGVSVAELTASNALVANLLPVTLGNMIGGCGLACFIFGTAELSN